jgi:hypothetical protein
MTISFFEQSTIIKGGAAVVIGNISDGYSWSRLLLNFLLIKAIENQRFQKVAVVCLDIGRKDILSLLSVAQAPQTRLQDRLLLFESLHQFDDYYRNDLTRREEAQEVAVFFFSLSELFITSSGIVSTPSSTASSMNDLFEKYLHLAVACTFEEKNGNVLSVSRADDGKNGSGVQSKISLSMFTNVNCSLHSASFLSFVKSQFPTVISVVPNDGTLSTQVAAQVQVIRRSTATNKISENLEMFSFAKNGVLVSPIVSTFTASSSSENQKLLPQSNKLSDQSVEGFDEVDKSSTFTPKDTASSLDASHQQRHIPSAISPKPNVRLITFDSTDPEFDEDSDPDADLDL